MTFPGHHRQVSDIKKTAEAAFSELGLTEEEAAEKYGLLSRYCITSDLYPEVVREKHNLRLCSVMLDAYTAESAGYIWVYYNQEGLMENGEVGRGAWWVYALWYLERDESGSWYVADIKEGP